MEQSVSWITIMGGFKFSDEYWKEILNDIDILNDFIK